jgi:integrase
MDPVSLLRRHVSGCEAKRPSDSYTSELEERRRGFQRCRCKIYAHGTFAGIRRKVGTKQSEWDLARLFIEPYVRAGSWTVQPSLAPPPAPDPPPSPDAPTPPGGKTPIAEAVAQCIQSQKSNGGADGTVRKYRTVLAGENGLLTFAHARGLRFVEEFTPSLVRALIDGWQVSPKTRRAKLSVVKPFFETFVEDGVISANPARIRLRLNRAMRAGAIDADPPRQPFSDEELKRMLDGCVDFGRTQTREWPKKKDGRQVVAISDRREYARKFDGGDLADFIQLSCHTGLRFLDVAKFRVSRLTPEGEVKLRAGKNGVWICVPIPEHLQKAIRNRAHRFGPHIFGDPTGRSDHGIYQSWNDRLNQLWKETGPYEFKPVHHRFRHTFVRMLLEQGASISLVAQLAGDSEDTIRKHYSNWVPELQEATRETLRKALAGFPRFRGV